MIRLALLSLAIVTPLAMAQTQPTTVPAGAWTSDAFGRRVLRPFDAAPYPHASRANGFKGSAETFGPEHYQDSTVGLFVPAGYTPGDTVDYVVHFHGHRNHVAKVFDQYKLEEEVVKSGVNAILIVPQGPLDAADSGGGKLELDDGGFKKLIDEVTAYLNAEHVLHTSTIGHIALSTHSGGYKVTAGILHRGGLTDHVTDVILLDSSYGSLEYFTDFVAMRPDARLVSFHTKHLDAANVELKGLLDKAHVTSRDLAEADVNATTLAPRGVTFVSTTLAHDDVPSGKDYLALMLGTSQLDKH